MAAAQHDLGELDEIDVEAIGEPGQRTFRLLLASGPTTASLWLEKEQMEQLAMVIDQQLTGASQDQPTGGLLTLDFASRFPSDPTIDFKAGRIAVGFEEQARRFAMTIDPLEDSEQSVTFVVGQHKAEALSAKIVTVAAAGRARCPLCGAPLDGGPHVCPASNGHAHV
jgi:uncharacterized repeat protein (TIGR03847 family)